MYTKTKTITMFAILAVTGLVLIAGSSFTSYSVLAVKTSSSHKGTSTSRGSSGLASSITSSKSKDLKTLITCETTSAKTAAGGLGQSQVLNCYSQAFGNATGTTNSTASTLATGSTSGSGSGGGGSSSSSSSAHGSSSGHSHHNSSGSSTSSSA
jgi:cellulose 1,4-beta-cellobiosidase